MEISLCANEGVKYRLLSFAEIDSWGKEAFKYWSGPEAPLPFFLDSGAFGAFTRDATIDLERYCSYIEEHKAQLYPYAALDVIGDWRGSARNYEVMRQRGLTPLPTFHMNSPLRELRRLLGLADYMALGGVVGASRLDMEPWLDKCWGVIKDFWPKRIHIFGVMAQWALERYPWYSADSSGAIVGAGMGRISVWENSRIFALPWLEYAHRYMDGSVVDNVSLSRAKGGSAHVGRRLLNVTAQIVLQRHITDVWSARGITWEDASV